ncbi:MAG TPA: DUF4838 domain-containing protein [Phycisphaerales bacterium]|nr:DUF4838 domain-containing protein [Phycisphaerales bacterium]
MRTFLFGTAFVAVLACSSMGAPGEGLTIVRDGVSDCVIVVPRNAPAPVARGASEIQHAIKDMSGATLAIVEEPAAVPPHAILLGPGPFLPPSAVLDRAKLGDDGFILRTEDGRVVIAGPGPRGTMYGCSAFLESLGMRWLSPRVTITPHQATITVPAMDRTEIPAFEYREPYFTEALDADWAARNRINGNFEHLDASTGGRIAYSIFVHSMDELVPQALHKDHPEYFPLINGKRESGYVQRCLTNPDVLRLAVEGVKASFRAHPEARICSVSQNDCARWCECPRCRAMTEKYGAHSGLYLWFANRVGEEIEKEFPDRLIDTLAYQFTEPPPTGITPRRNVRVRLCPIDICVSHPAAGDDFPASRAFMDHLAAWGRITDKLYIWHYNTDFAHYLMPFPDFAAFIADTRLYHASGVRGIFFEGDYAPGGGGSDAELRSYVMAKLLWNPDVDTDALIDEWFRGVYGPAAAPMREWFDLVQDRARPAEAHLRIYDPPSPKLFPAEMLARGDALFDRAEALAATDVQRDSIARARLALRYVHIAQGQASDAALKSFLADVRRFGITQISEGQSVEAWEQRRAARGGK